MAFVLLSVIYSVLLFLFGVFIGYITTRGGITNKLFGNVLQNEGEQKAAMIAGVAFLILFISMIYFIILKSYLN